MPIYEYECPRCGRFDTLQKMSAPALDVHDVCGSKVTKLMSASAFALKGSGFYITDYGGRNPAAITGRGEKGEKSDKAEKADKAEKKPEAKAEAKSSACASCPAAKSAA
jgi:putative FmdB family regulatory protein